MKRAAFKSFKVIEEGDFSLLRSTSQPVTEAEEFDRAKYVQKRNEYFKQQYAQYLAQETWDGMMQFHHEVDHDVPVADFLRTASRHWLDDITLESEFEELRKMVYVAFKEIVEKHKHDPSLVHEGRKQRREESIHAQRVKYMMEQLGKTVAYEIIDDLKIQHHQAGEEPENLIFYLENMKGDIGDLYLEHYEQKFGEAVVRNYDELVTAMAANLK